MDRSKQVVRTGESKSDSPLFPTDSILLDRLSNEWEQSSAAHPMPACLRSQHHTHPFYARLLAVIGAYKNNDFFSAALRDSNVPNGVGGNPYFVSTCYKSLGRKGTDLTTSDVAFATIAVRLPIPAAIAPAGSGRNVAFPCRS